MLLALYFLLVEAVHGMSDFPQNIPEAPAYSQKSRSGLPAPSDYGLQWVSLPGFDPALNNVAEKRETGLTRS